MAATTAHRVEERCLYEIISTVTSSLNLEEVLTGVVRLLSEASAVHACFVYLVDKEAERLELRAASEPYEQLVGQIALERGEGIAWWALENREPVLIRENAVADPRFKYVPELEEERFQSFVSVPVFDQAGTPIAAISLHTQAPREFTDAEADFLVSVAALGAGALENGRLYAHGARDQGDRVDRTAGGEDPDQGFLRAALRREGPRERPLARRAARDRSRRVACGCRRRACERAARAGARPPRAGLALRPP